MGKQAEYMRLRALGWSAKEAYRAAQINVAFEAAKALGLVELKVKEDAMPYDPGDNEDDTPHQKRELQDRLARFGSVGLVSYAVLACGHMHQVDSVWGFIGDDVQDNGYDVDLKVAALEAVASLGTLPSNDVTVSPEALRELRLLVAL